MNILIAILIFSFIIIFHEFGHFITAKKCGIKVLEFSLGLGPTIWGIQGKETKYSIKLLPFGGACMMEGEDEASDSARAFGNKPLWQRFLVVLNGPMFNFILAFLLSLVMIGCVGVDRPIISDTIDGYAAQKAGLSSGDEIVSINSYRVHFYREISLYTFFHQGEQLHIQYKRDGQVYNATVTPQLDEESGRYLIGVQGGNYEKVNPLETITYSVWWIKYQIYTTFKSLSALFTGMVSMNEMSGPVGIVKTIGDTYEQSVQVSWFLAVMNLLNITILLSANLGVMNLLPIPALDGGRIVFFLVEAIRGKKIDENIEGYVNMISFFLLMGLMVFVMFNDISKLMG
ncbi:MAG: RIP metalloprotease RseP [Lachnospiraceae bacterium]|nr:RIP metalloprotease RseP [Lachnospiraceae bacterium]